MGGGWGFNFFVAHNLRKNLVPNIKIGWEVEDDEDDDEDVSD